MQLRACAAVLLAGAVSLACGAQSGAKAGAKSGAEPAGSLKAVLATARARVAKSDVRASGRLVEIAANGTRTNNTIVLESHSFPDGLRTMVTVTSAGNSSVRYLLAQDAEGHTAIDSFTKGEKKPVRLSAERWGEGVAGTLFYPEDFADGQFFWAKQTVLPAQKYGARDCFVLRSEPGPGQTTIYASVTTWIDQKTGAPVYVEASRIGGGPAKQFVFYDLEQMGGVWEPRQVEAKLSGRPGSSVLVLERGSAHAHLQRNDFNLTAVSQLTRSNGP